MIASIHVDFMLNDGETLMFAEDILEYCEFLKSLFLSQVLRQIS